MKKNPCIYILLLNKNFTQFEWFLFSKELFLDIYAKKLCLKKFLCKGPVGPWLRAKTATLKSNIFFLNLFFWAFICFLVIFQSNLFLNYSVKVFSSFIESLKISKYPQLILFSELLMKCFTITLELWTNYFQSILSPIT